MMNTQMIPAAFFGLNDWFDSLNDNSKTCKNCTPRASVSEKNGVYTLEVDLPGVKKSDIEVNVEGDTLSIKAVRKSVNSEMAYERSFKLSDDLNPDSAEAFLEDGVLTFKFTKKQTAASRKLVIK